MSRVVVAPVGQIDMASAPDLADLLTEARQPGVSEIVVDLSQVEFLDSAGVRVLVQAARESEKEEIRLYLRGANGWVSRVLEISGVGDYLPPPPEERRPEATPAPSEHIRQPATPSAEAV